MTNIHQHQFWRNEFLDVIYFERNIIVQSRWCIYIDCKYITSKVGLNQAKHFVNNERGIKTKWVKINSN